MTKTSRAATAIALGAGWLAASCGPVVPNITVPTPGAIPDDSQTVSVVIVQPTSRLVSVNIIDGRGELVGQLRDRSHTLIHVPEGPTLLYAVLDNKAATADRIEGTLVAGRVYYATVGPRPDGGVALLTLNRRSREDRWSHRDEYLAKTPRLQMDPQRVTRAKNELGNAVPIMEAGNAHVEALGAAGLAEHMIQESDGF
jgi:hypothetical protein